jgi:hypothetical protein
MAEALLQIQALAGWLAERLDAATEPPPDARDDFRRALEHIAAATAGRAPAKPPVPLPVLRHLPAALARISRDAAAAATRPRLEALAPGLAWTQNPNYRAQPPSADFLANYGYAQLAGPPGVPTLVETDRCAFGLLLLGPRLLYPTHRHPAAELYLPLTPGEWQRGDEPWREVPPAMPIHHPPGLPHATRAGLAPLLALYLWLGDLATHARMGGMQPSPSEGRG